jgi:hypothetical protein
VQAIVPERQDGSASSSSIDSTALSFDFESTGRRALLQWVGELVSLGLIIRLSFLWIRWQLVITSSLVARTSKAKKVLPADTRGMIMGCARPRLLGLAGPRTDKRTIASNDATMALPSIVRGGRVDTGAGT